MLDDELDSCANFAARIFCAAGKILGSSCTIEAEVEEVLLGISEEGGLGSC